MKIKNTLLNFIILLLYFCYPTSAQIKAEINYKLTVNSSLASSPYVVNYVDYIYNNKSIEFPLKIYEKSTTENISENQAKKVIVSGKPSFTFKNFKNKELKLTDDISFKRYLIADTINNFKWKITSEHQKILNYNCTKAVSSFRGRTYTAWFAEKITIQNGPWKFCGLPGLIIKVYDEKNIFNYEMTGINLRADFDTSIVEIPSFFVGQKALNHNEFMILVNKKIEDYKRMSKVITTESNGATVSGSATLAEKQEKF